jgi:hypothetical protein
MKHHPHPIPRLTGALVGVGLMLLSLPLVAGLFGPKGDTAEEKRASIGEQREEMLAELVRLKPELKARLNQAAGFATFKQMDVNLFMLASSRGYGVLRDNRSGKDTYMGVASLGTGVGMGIKDLRVIFVFNDAQVMQEFMEKGWQFGGKGDVAAKHKDTGLASSGGATAQVDFQKGTVSGSATTDHRAGSDKTDQVAAGAATDGGMEIYQFTESGLALQATVQGTKYWKDTALNE